MMWECDPFKAKWSVIARAYSTMRDWLGKDRVKLDQFLDLVCPQIGIIGRDKYLEEMNWSVEYDNDGPHNLVQTFVRNIDSFSDVLRNTTMDDHDIVYFCARQGFIPPGAAVMMLDQPLRGPGLAAGQTLLAASAMIPKTHITPADFRRAANEHPVETGSVILGFDVEALLTDDESFKMDVGHHSRHAASSLSNNPMLWSGSNAELYDPAAGYLNLDQAVEKSWNTIDISQPEEFDQTLTVGGMFDDGHLIPTGKTRILAPSDQTNNLQSPTSSSWSIAQSGLRKASGHAVPASPTLTPH